MPTTLFGLPACEVEHPDGEVVKYLIEATPGLPATEEQPEEWRAWIVTSPTFDPKKPDKGGQYRVAEYSSGRFGCNCPAHTKGKNRGGRWRRVKENPACKHCRAVHDELMANGEGVTCAEQAPQD